MVHDPRVTQQLTRLGGVYRDPARVDRDAASLLKSSVGSHLTPITAEMFEDDGSVSTVLVLQGTIAIHFRGVTYQLLSDIYLPPGYPIRPPVCYIRLADNMYLKDNHRHVGKDGKVYLPYLHEWSQYSHNLVELVVAMSSVFSADPPVFTRAPATTTTTSSSQPPAAAALSMPTAYTTSSSIPVDSWRVQQQQREAEAKLAREAAEANAAAEAVRQAEREERQKRETAAKQSAWEVARKQQMQTQVQTKIIRYLQEVSRQTQQQVQRDMQDHHRLLLANDKVQKQLTAYQSRVDQLTTAVKEMDTSLVEIKGFIEENKKNAHEQKDNTTLTADQMVQPATALHRQMLDLSSEDSAISDALYFIDRAFYRGHLDCTAHLKQVRKLAKRQFLVRAHMLKINQVLVKQGI